MFILFLKDHDFLYYLECEHNNMLVFKHFQSACKVSEVTIIYVLKTMFCFKMHASYVHLLPKKHKKLLDIVFAVK